MKTNRLIPIALVVLSLSTVALAQKEAQTEAQKSFDKLKTLAGSWEGRVTTVPADPSVEGKTAQITLRVTSMGNAFLHEAKLEGRPDDPITMMYLDGDRLMLTHYCDAGNRPRMVGRLSANGKAVEFEFLDIVGNTEYGHMHRGVFNLVDEEHHTEDWTFMVGDKPVQAHFDLHRVK